MIVLLLVLCLCGCTTINSVNDDVSKMENAISIDSATPGTTMENDVLSVSGIISKISDGDDLYGIYLMYPPSVTNTESGFIVEDIGLLEGFKEGDEVQVQYTLVSSLPDAEIHNLVQKLEGISHSDLEYDQVSCTVKDIICFTPSLVSFKLLKENGNPYDEDDFVVYEIDDEERIQSFMETLSGIVVYTDGIMVSPLMLYTSFNIRFTDESGNSIELRESTKLQNLTEETDYFYHFNDSEYLKMPLMEAAKELARQSS